MERVVHLAILFCVAVMLVGCAAPGTPLLRASESNGEGKLIEGCKNISSNARVDQYISNSYLTTWGSASKEGAVEGFSEQVEIAGSTKGGNVLQQLIKIDSSLRAEPPGVRNSLNSNWREKNNSLFSSAVPFCRYYSANYLAVSKATAMVVRNLEHRPILVDESLGIFETNFVEHEHRAARWRDRYVILLNEVGENQTIIKVFRIVYISRSGNAFNLASSVGHNETWIMTRIADLLEKQKNHAPH